MGRGGGGQTLLAVLVESGLAAIRLQAHRAQRTGQTLTVHMMTNM